MDRAPIVPPFVRDLITKYYNGISQEIQDMYGRSPDGDDFLSTIQALERLRQLFATLLALAEGPWTEEGQREINIALRYINGFYLPTYS